MLFRLGFHSLGLILTNNTTNLCSGIKRGQKRSDELREQIHWKFRVFKVRRFQSQYQSLIATRWSEQFQTEGAQRIHSAVHL